MNKLITGTVLMSLLMVAMGGCQQPGVRNNGGNGMTGSAALPNRSAFQQTVNGKKTNLYILKNDNGIKVAITNYGGRIVGILTPDRNGEYADIALGYDSLNGYLHNTNNYFGALIGRFANRIARGKFTLHGKRYSIPVNNGVNSLHGGTVGFDSHVWNAEQLNDRNLRLTYVSKDMEEGYPGKLTIQVIYTLTDANELRIEYTAITDKPTVVNFTNHTYFNLSGAGSGSVMNQEVMINADSYTPIDSTMIPTGQIAPVKGTPFDFTKMTAFGKRINEKNQQLEFAHGYDDNFVLNKEKPYALSLAAKAYDPASGRTLTVYTTQPGIQVYTGNFLDGSVKGHGGKKYTYRSAFTMETQHYPDSPNHANFPSTELDPGQIFNSITIFKFGVEKQGS